SHKLDEVLAVADVVTVIRDGRVIDTVPALGLTKERIATMMVGREVLLRIEHTPAHPGETVLEVADLTVVDDRGVTALDHIALSVRAGEIVGIAGVDGNGQSELLEAIAGLDKPSFGTVTLKGTDITRASVAARRAAGMAYIPDDRHHVGTAPRMSVADNVGATHLSPPVARTGWLSLSGLSQFASRLIKTYDIRGATPTTPVGSLSGGNMQKVVIAREFESDPALLVVSQPTRGVDVGAMEFVHKSLVSARDRGAAVLLVSADLNEVMSLSDRLLVIHRGHIVDEFTHDTMSEIAVGLAMGGQAVDEEAIAAANALHAEKAELVSTDLDGDGIPDALQKKTPVAPPATEPAKEALPSRSTGSTILKTIFTNAAQPILAVVAALVIGAIIIAMIGQNPGAAYSELFLSPLTTPYGIGALLAHSVQLLILSAAVIVSFRAGFFNIGGEGQLYVGALAGALTGIALKGSSLPSFLVIIIVLVVAFVVGGVWGWIPGALLAFWNVNIIVTTLMMSSIATLL
ncbi:MAG TPA: ATP-binding cassette domain-containing protein, partial [Propionibacteriaceae bacterium]